MGSLGSTSTAEVDDNGTLPWSLVKKTSNKALRSCFLSLIQISLLHTINMTGTEDWCKSYVVILLVDLQCFIISLECFCLQSGYELFLWSWMIHIKNSMMLLRLFCFKHVLTHSPSNTSKQVTLHSHVQSVSAGLPSEIPIIPGRNNLRRQFHIHTFVTESFISCELNVHPTNDIMASYK